MIFDTFYEVHQHFNQDPEIEDIKVEIQKTFKSSKLIERIRPGMKIAVTGGSRGIGKIGPILKAVGEALRSEGAAPFVFTAMGSHGGGTSKGQLDILELLGITESKIGMPVRSSMQTELVGKTKDGMPVYIDSLAWKADGILIVNRIKKHTVFHGPIESGLSKMLAFGLGKVRQADLIHSNLPSDISTILASVAQVMINTGKIFGGMGIIENRLGQPAYFHSLLPEDIPSREKDLLKESNRFFPGLPFNEADVLIVRRLGKNISGCGMDPSVLGRFYIEGEPEPSTPSIQVIGVLELTRETDGNALGAGLADLTTRRFVDAIDFQKTYLNARTSKCLRRAKTPITLKNDKELLEVALGCVRGRYQDCPRVAMIDDTLHLETVLISESLKDDLHRDGVTIGKPIPLKFDAENNIQFKS